MKKLIILLIVGLLLVNSSFNVHAFDLYGLIRAYEEGRAAGRQAEIEEEQLRLMRLEQERRELENQQLKRFFEEERLRRDAKAKEEKQKQEAFAYFNDFVKPKVIIVHPDFDDIVLDKEQRFFKWADQQRPALRFAATESSDPEDIIWAISEYKKSNPLLFKSTSRGD